MFWKKPSLKALLPPPVKVDHGEYSMILSAHDDPARPTPSLLRVSLAAIEAAMGVDVRGVSARLPRPPLFPELWPGEHYKLLAGLVRVLAPKMVIEIGTSTGLSALCLKQSLPKGGKVTTFDVVKWDTYPNTVLREEDFQEGSLTQRVENLAEEAVFQANRELLQSAGLIFIDATHDGKLEAALLEKIQRLSFPGKVYLLFDDIRVWTMLKMWREIRLPKLDLTSFGHWSGTGLVEL